MKRILAAFAVIVMMCGTLHALPQGPGGTLWLSLQRSDANDNIDIMYVDIDENWDPVNTPGAVTVVTGLHDDIFAGNSDTWYYCRKTGMTSLWTDGTPVIAAYYDNDVYTSGTTNSQLMDVLNIQKDGTITVLHDGSRDGAYNQPHTMGASNAVVDEAREFGTAINETNPAIYIGGSYNSYADSVWHDTDGDGDYNEFSNAKRVGSVNFDYDVELLGNKMYMHTYNGIERIVFDSTDNSYTPEATAKAFYKESGSAWNISSEGKLAVGDTNGDGIDDVYFFNGSDRLLVGADLDDNGVMNDSEIRYANQTASVFGGIPGDIELFQCDNGSWVFMHVTSYEGWETNKGKRIEIWSLLDNGDLNENDYKQIIYWHNRTGQGDSSFSLVNGTNVSYPDLEFAAAPAVTVIPGDANGDGKVDGGDLSIWQANYDPIGTGNNSFATGDFNGDGKIDGGDLSIWQANYDPIGAAGEAMGANIPEPATLLLLGSGLLGGLGVIRRRRS